MRVFVDASVLVAASAPAEVHHVACLTWLNEAVDAGDTLVTSAHTLAEAYAALTRQRVPPALARRIVRAYERTATLVEPATTDYRNAVADAARARLPSGAVYDAVHARTARRARARLLATLNGRHFRPFWPPERLLDLAVR